MTEEKNVLRWGGLAGMVSPILTIVTAMTLFAFMPQTSADTYATYGSVTGYPAVKPAYTVGETFSLVSVILSVAFYLGLYQALRGTSLAPSLFGIGLSFMGMAVLAVEGIPRVVFSRISDLYHAPGATPQDQATLSLIWETTHGIFNELDTAALIFQATAYILFGIAMLRNPAFGKRLGGITIILALAGLLGVYVLGIDSSLFAPLGLFVFILLPILLGWKMYRLSRNPQQLVRNSQLEPFSKAPSDASSTV